MERLLREPFLSLSKLLEMDGVQSAELLKRITSNPDIFGGKPIIRNYRFAVTDILDLLAEGMTPEQIITDFPFLEREDISASLLYASISIAKSRIIHAA